MKKEKCSKSAIALLSLMHMGVDFLCAFALFGRFIGRYADLFFLYNFCAFALQMPLGMLLDELTARSARKCFPSLLFTFAGVLLTSAGALLSPVVLGIGNALFHVGGGVLTIREDDHSGLDGQGLGVFVAPGAIGLALGMLLKGINYPVILAAISLLHLLLFFFLYRLRERLSNLSPARTTGKDGVIEMILLCFTVVIARSFVGMAVSFSWKTGTAAILLSVFALACGKSAGGFLSHVFGMRKTIIFSLLFAAVMYFFGDRMIFGIPALFLFNMTMPLTLYLLAGKMKGNPGLAFGILTFALFLGYLPVLYGLARNIPPYPSGTAGSLLSLVLLLLALRKRD